MRIGPPGPAALSLSLPEENLLPGATLNGSRAAPVHVLEVIVQQVVEGLRETDRPDGSVLARSIATGVGTRASGYRLVIRPR